MYFSYRRTQRFFNIPPKLAKDWNKTGVLHIERLVNVLGLRCPVEFRYITSLGRQQLLHLNSCKIFRRWEDQIMALPKNWKMINVRIEASEKDKFLHWCEENPMSATDILEELGSRLYKLSASWVDSNQAWVVTVSGTKDSAKNRNQSMSSWSNDVSEALYMTLYKVVVICEDKDWEAYESASGSWG